MALLRTLAVFFAVASLAGAAELTTLDNKKSSGDIVSIDGKELVFKTASGEERHELTKLSIVEVGKDRDPGGKFITVNLIDGSEFRCADFKIKGNTAELTLLGTKQVIELPANRVLYMVRDLSDAKINQDFRGILSKRGKRDIWVLSKGKDDALESLDSVPGTFGAADATGGAIEFEIEATGQKTKIQMSRIYGMILAPSDAVKKVSQTVCRVVDANRNVVVAASVSITDKKSVAIETVTGVKIEYPEISSIARFDFGAGALQFLSNMNPVQVDLSSTEGKPEPYRRDRNLDNDDIKIAGKVYPKGLALHSRTVLTYDLDGQYKIFEALAGVDDCVEGESKVTLTIEGDFKPLFKGVIEKGKDKPKPLVLQVLNVKKLTITVESDFLDLGNQVDLADAKVRK